MQNKINKLISYANQKELLDPRDNDFMFNQLCYLLNVTPKSSFKAVAVKAHIDDILNDIADKFQKFDTNTERELFKSKVIGTVIDRPSNIEAKFKELKAKSSQDATEFFYNFAKDVNYVKEREVAKNIEYQTKSEYGDIDITINLSKPEKSTKEIEMLKKAKASNWPACFLCKEQEGLYGSMHNPDRSNHRIVGVDINQSKWYLQYSPFSYFNEHSILLSETHSDMKINRNTFANLLDFVEQFPHYMIGSNADIPIVGGSMLTHDHYQCGNYEFPLFKAMSHVEAQFGGVSLYSVKWPMHTVKLVADSKYEILEVADKVLTKWLAYADPDNNIYDFIDERHNTITPIARYHNGHFEMYLILRNNLTTDEHPTGIYHVDSSRHHIKQENIGLIEAMGLAVLPGRLKAEMEQLATAKELPTELEKHKPLFDAINQEQPKNNKQFLYSEIGKIFVHCLEDCGVFKYNQDKYIEFIRSIDE
ncbi:UDP-glucose--hexose-1-phosphate uridylyltransferase [Mollicutes bacterium LVI A0039]|nr:UDP-glucose--hexose-1-phosphate uridylyltransferase [Mollicutes bacterium LVI A0039]